MQNPTTAAEDLFAIRGDRRNGIDRLFLTGRLDRSSVLALEAELNTFAHAEGALILDLRDLDSIDRWGIHALERAQVRASRGSLRLSIVCGPGPVLNAFEAAGRGQILRGSDLSELLESGDGEWSPISLPSLLGQRASGHLRVAGGHG